MDKLNCLCAASENQVLDEVENFDHIPTYGKEHLPKFMTSYHLDGFEQQDELNNPIHVKDTLPTQNMSTNSYQIEQDDDTKQKAPQSINRRSGQKRGNSLVLSRASSVDTCTTVSLSQSFQDEDDEDEDEVSSTTVPTEVVVGHCWKNPFRSTRGADPPKQEHEAYRYLLRMKPDNYICDTDEDDDDLFVGELSYLRPIFISQAVPPPSPIPDMQ
jgi:hypothetical protein